MPRDRFDTTIRERISALLHESLAAERVDYFVMLGESRLARLHFIARTPVGTDYRLRCRRDRKAGGAHRARLGRRTETESRRALWRGARQPPVASLFASELPLSYQERVTPASAVSDLERLEAAEQSGRVEVKLSAAQGDDGSHQHLKLFRRGRPRPLVGDSADPREHGTDGTLRTAVQSAQSDLHIADFAVRLPQAAALNDETTRRSFIDLLEKPVPRPGRERRFQPPGPAGGSRRAADQHPARLQPLPAAGRFAVQPGLCAALSGDAFPDYAGTGRPVRSTLFSGSRRGTHQSVFR
jgi:hypothetical protein